MKRRSATARICVVGSGTRFLSGISVYTVRLANALREHHHVSVVTLRQLLPARFYPGRARVGRDLTDLDVAPGIRRFDGIDWYWIPSLLRAVSFVVRERTNVLILEWWTGTVLHTYLALMLLARLLGMAVVIEFHEVLDTGEARVPFARWYARLMAPVVIRLADAFTVHSRFDAALVRERYRLGRRPLVVLPHGPHDHYKPAGEEARPARREAPAGIVNLLFFGVIRPYKGLEDLVAAFDSIPEDRIGAYWLTVVGETWEGWDLPSERIAASRYGNRITFVNQYVSDAELDAYLRGADAVVLPYRRSSLSGPLHVAMSYGLPIVITDIGGNPEAAEGYPGITFVPPADPKALERALTGLSSTVGSRYSHPRSWSDTADAYDGLLSQLGFGIETSPDQGRAVSAKASVGTSSR